MAVPASLLPGLRLPAIAAPMFLTSGPDLVVETCRGGIIGTFPALNARTTDGFSAWLDDIRERLSALDNPARYGVNLIVHRTNPRLAADLEVVRQHEVPLVITSLGAVRDVVDAVHEYGGLVFHDVINRRHAEKAAEAGVDGIICVSGGAGGHAGTLNPFALISEVRQVFDGTVILAGAISKGEHILAARAMGADLAYLGTRFIATRESLVPEEHKNMILASRAGDIVYTPNVSGVPANFMKASLDAAGIDPDAPPTAKLNMDNEARAWKEIWSAGQGVGSITDTPYAFELCERLSEEYHKALENICNI